MEPVISGSLIISNTMEMLREQSLGCTFRDNGKKKIVTQETCDFCGFKKSFSLEAVWIHGGRAHGYSGPIPPTESDHLSSIYYYLGD